MNKNVLIVGGTSGIGLSIAKELSLNDGSSIYVLGRTKPVEKVKYNVSFIKFDLLKDDYLIIKDIIENFNIDTLILSAGIGRVAEFKDINDEEIISLFTVNSISTIRIIKYFYEKLLFDTNANCVVISSISGFVSSPLFSVYSATKASLNRFIESINIELYKSGSVNRVLNVSPGYIEGTGFEDKSNNDSSKTTDLAREIIFYMNNKSELYIPKYDEVYKKVICEYNKNPNEFGVNSYEYKIKSGRIKK